MSSSQGLVGLVKILVWVVVIYFAVTAGWPWLQRQLGSRGGGETAAVAGAAADGETGRCVGLARQASESFGAELRRFRQPPYDLTAWANALAGVEERIWQAESACSCPGEACGRAEAALAELRDMTSRVDGVIRGDATSFRNPARQQERIDELLDEADALARAGS